MCCDRILNAHLIKPALPPDDSPVDFYLWTTCIMGIECLVLLISGGMSFLTGYVWSTDAWLAFLVTAVLVGAVIVIHSLPEAYYFRHLFIPWSDKEKTYFNELKEETQMLIKKISPYPPPPPSYEEAIAFVSGPSTPPPSYEEAIQETL